MDTDEMKVGEGGASVGVLSKGASVTVMPGDEITVPIHLLDAEGKAVRADSVVMRVWVPPHLGLERVMLVTSGQSVGSIRLVDRYEKRHQIVVLGRTNKADGHQFSLRLRAVHAGRNSAFRIEYMTYAIDGHRHCLPDRHLPDGIQISVEANSTSRAEYGEVRVVG